MTDITPDAQFDNFFALFEQPVQFAVNQERLDQQLRLLQKRYHPDNLVADSKNVADSAQAKQQSEQASALINQAYQTLRDRWAGAELRAFDCRSGLLRRCDANAYGFGRCD